MGRAFSFPRRQVDTTVLHDFFRTTIKHTTFVAGPLQSIPTEPSSAANPDASKKLIDKLQRLRSHKMRKNLLKIAGTANPDAGWRKMKRCIFISNRPRIKS
jgi:hypothetical protein